jgi:hypothetical protein
MTTTEQSPTPQTALPPGEQYVSVGEGDDTLKFSLPEEPIEGKLGKEHKKLLAQNWQVVVDYAGGEDANHDSLKGPVEDVIKNLGDSRFDRATKRSFEKRLEAVGRLKWLSELEASNSPWHDVIELAKDKLHGSDRNNAQDKFLENYMATSIIALKGRMENAGVNTVEMEDKIADMYTSYLNRMTHDDTKEGSTKFKDILSNEAEFREMGTLTSSQILDQLNKESTEDSTEQQVAELTEASVPNQEEIYEVLWQLDLGEVRGKATTAGENIKDWVRETGGRLKQSSQSVVRGVLDGVNNKLPEREELLKTARAARDRATDIGTQAWKKADEILDSAKSRIPDKEELKKAGRRAAKLSSRAAVIGMAALALRGSMDTSGQAQSLDSTSTPAGNPEHIIETETPNVQQMLEVAAAQAAESPATQIQQENEPQYIRSDAYGDAIEEARRNQAAQAQEQQASTNSNTANQETVEQQPANETVGPAQQAIREISQNVQETPDYSKVLDILTQRDFEVEERDGIVFWRPKEGQYWSHFLGVGLGYGNPVVYGDGGLLDKNNLHNNPDEPLKAGEWVPVPEGVFQTSSE